MCWFMSDWYARWRNLSVGSSTIPSERAFHACWGHLVEMDHVQGTHCGSGDQELWSEGHGCLSGRQLYYPMVDTRGEGGLQTEEGNLLGWFGWEVDEIHTEMLKALDTMGLSWLTCLCSVVWRSEPRPTEWRTGVVIPIFKKRGREASANCRTLDSGTAV